MSTELLVTFERFSASRGALWAVFDCFLEDEPHFLVIDTERWETVPVSQVPAGTHLSPVKGSRTVPTVTAGWTPTGSAVLQVPIPAMPQTKSRKPPAKVMTERAVEAMRLGLLNLLATKRN